MALRRPRDPEFCGAIPSNQIVLLSRCLSVIFSQDWRARLANPAQIGVSFASAIPWGPLTAWASGAEPVFLPRSGITIC